MNYKKGFTLIELLLVIGVVTLLSSFLFYNTSEARKKAEDAHMQTESEQIKTAVALYQNDTGKYPLTSKHASSPVRRGVVHSESDPDSDYLATMQELVDGGYISEIPRSPDGQSYAYGVSEDGENAMFVATLKTAKPRTSSNSCEFIFVAEEDSNEVSFEGEDCFYQQGDSGCNGPDENGMYYCWDDPGEWICMPEQQPPVCYTVEGTPSVCTVEESTIPGECSPYGDQIICAEPETIYTQVCTPPTPSQIICEGGGSSTIGTPPSLPEEVVCGGGYESDYCQCI